MKKVNTFIVGAPKCGTTALCHYLSQHPSIFVCEPKEPHYFAKLDMPDRKHYIKDEQSYADLYKDSSDDQKVLADGSVWYLYCRNAIRLIAEYNNAAKIIIMMRRPDEMVYSFHSQALESFDEDVTEFSTAWNMATGKIHRSHLPKYCFAPEVLAYDKIACYGSQLENVYRYFNKEQVHLIFFEEFSKDTNSQYNSLLSFLELERYDDVSFEKINENSYVKNRALGTLLTHPPQTLVKLASIMKNMLGIEKLGILKKLLAFNTIATQRQPLDECTKRDIIRVYKDDVQLLQSITGRDLSSWLQ